MTLEELNVKITAQSDQFKKQIDQVNKQLQSMKTQSQTVGKTLNNMFNLQMITTGIRVLKNAYTSLSKMAQGYFDKVEQETKLAEVMRQRMNATTSQINAIKKLTEQEQSLGVVEDDVLMAGLQQLGTFSKYPETLSTLNGAMANLIAQQKGYNATAQDAINIGNLMGKVLQGQTSALTRVGITFTEAQEQVLKYGTEQEKAAMLAEVITDNVGNMNKALLNTPRGQLKQLQISLDDIGDTLTEAILSPLMKILPAVNNVVSKGQVAARYIRALMQGLFGKVDSSPVTDTVKNNEELADSIKDVNEAYQEGTSSIDDFNVASGFDQQIAADEIIPKDDIEDDAEDVADAIETAVKPVVDFIKNNKDGILSIVKAVSLFVSPLTRVAAIVGTVVEQLKSNPEMWERFTNIFKQLTDMGPRVALLLQNIGEALGDVIASVLETILDVWDTLGPSIMTILGAITDWLTFVTPIISQVISLVLPIFNVIAFGLEKIFSWLDQIGALEPIIWLLVSALIAWKVATLAQAAAQWVLNASLLAKIGLITMGVGLVVGAAVMAYSDIMASKANEVQQYAAGAYGIDRGQLFIANERGPEMVGTMDGKSAVANNSQIVEGIAYGVRQGVVDALSSTNGLGGQNVKVTIDFNTQEAARILRPKIQTETIRVGGR